MLAMKRSLAPVVVAALACACSAGRPAATVQSEFPLLNPLLRLQPDLEFKELQPFTYKIRGLIETNKKAGRVVDAAVYFRDLENGPLRGVNFEEEFTPASLLKVPLLMAALARMEKDPSFASQKVTFDIPYRGQSYLSNRALFPGTEYTIEEVVRALIVHSDNDALSLLRVAVPQAEQDQVYRDFGLIIPDVRGIEDKISLRGYATFFRVLYNASFLSKEMSQKALGLLAESTFKDGLVAGVPPSVVVAHKYGERYYSSENLRQLHDCGIVYHPKRHYNLCVMTRGKDFGELAGVIRDISALVYDEVTKHGMPQ